MRFCYPPFNVLYYIACILINVALYSIIDFCLSGMGNMGVGMGGVSKEMKFVCFLSFQCFVCLTF